MKRDSYSNLFKIIVISIIFVVLLFLNCNKQSVVKVDLQAPDIWYNGMQTYDPHLSFPKGQYEVTFHGSGKVLLCNGEGTVLGMGSTEDPVLLELDKDESDIIVCSDGRNVTGTQWQKEGLIFYDIILLTIVFATAVSFAVIKFSKHKKFSEKEVIFLLLGAIVLLASFPVFSKSILYGQDATFHLFRIEGMKDAILEGQFPVRIHPTLNNGYGYITASVYPELFLYIPAFLRMLGISNVLSYQIFVLFVNAMTAFFTYIAAKGISKSKYVGCVASIIYTLSTWRFINLYYRAAIGEALAITFFPLLFYGLYCILKGNEKKWWIFTIACSGIFMSHIISTLLAAIVIIIFLLVFSKAIFTKNRFIALVKAGTTTVLVNAWFLVPFIRSYVFQDLFVKNKAGEMNFHEHAIVPVQFLDLFGTKFGSSLWLNEGIENEMSLTLGLIFLVCFLFSVAFCILKKKQSSTFQFVMIGLSVCLLFMTTTLFPWDFLQQNNLVLAFCTTLQFPWRFLSIVSAMIVLVATSSFHNVFHSIRAKKISLLVIAVISIMSAMVWSNAYKSENAPLVQEGWAISTSGSTGWGTEYFRTDTNLSLFDRNKYTASEDVTISSYQKDGTHISLDLDGSLQDAWVEVPLLNYPGYKAINETGEKLEIVDGTNNTVRVLLDDNSAKVDIKYEGFWYYRLAEVISTISLGVLIITIYKQKKSKFDECEK